MRTFLAIITWSGKDEKFWVKTERKGTDDSLKEYALQCGIRRLAKIVGYEVRYVKQQVLDPNKQRWEVTEQ